jgi:hypothetical protein
MKNFNILEDRVERAALVAFMVTLVAAATHVVI